jgi:parallel beta-helix repeat protein
MTESPNVEVRYLNIVDGVQACVEYKRTYDGLAYCNCIARCREEGIEFDKGDGHHIALKNLVKQNALIEDGGIRVHDSPYCSVSSNTVILNLSEGGILIEDSADSSTVDHNLVQENVGHCILVQDSDDNLVFENTCEDNTMHGILLLDTEGNRVTCNTVVGHLFGAGIPLFVADDNCIDENAISGNADGLTDQIFCGAMSENNTGSNVPVASPCCFPALDCQNCAVPAMCETQAAIEVDASSIKSECGDSVGSTLTIPDVTVGAQSNRILIVTAGAEAGTANCDLSGVGAAATYGGQPMQRAVSAVSDLSGYRACNGLFYLLDPPMGTANVEITFPGDVDQRHAGAVVVYNAKQQQPEATSADGAEGQGIDNPSSTPIGVLTPNALAIDIMTWGNPGTFTPNEVDQTERWQESCASSSSATSTREASSAGPLTLGWGHSSAPSAGTRQAHSLAAFAPAP